MVAFIAERGVPASSRHSVLWCPHHCPLLSINSPDAQLFGICKCPLVSLCSLVLQKCSLMWRFLKEYCSPVYSFTYRASILSGQWQIYSPFQEKYERQHGRMNPKTAEVQTGSSSFPEFDYAATFNQLNSVASISYTEYNTKESNAKTRDVLTH